MTIASSDYSVPKANEPTGLFSFNSAALSWRLIASID